MTRNKQILSILLALLLAPFDAVLARDNNAAEQAHALMQEFIPTTH